MPGIDCFRLTFVRLIVLASLTAIVLSIELAGIADFDDTLCGGFGGVFLSSFFCDVDSEVLMTRGVDLTSDVSRTDDNAS